MKTTKHTPGPWTIVEDVNIVPVDEPDIEMVGPCYIAFTSGRYIHELERIANARLLATAPELLESLQAIYRICEAVRHTAGLGKNQILRMEKAQAVIAKATGRAA